MVHCYTRFSRHQSMNKKKDFCIPFNLYDHDQHSNLEGHTHTWVHVPPILPFWCIVWYSISFICSYRHQSNPWTNSKSWIADGMSPIKLTEYQTVEVEGRAWEHGSMFQCQEIAKNKRHSNQAGHTKTWMANMVHCYIRLAVSNPWTN